MAEPQPRVPRVLVVWCPDWPVVATAPAEGDHGPVAVVVSGHVLACSDEARSAGVRRGQRLRLAQRLCPELRLRERDQEAEARRFEPVAAAVEAFTPRVEILRPGLCAIPVKGPARYFGGEEALAGKVRAAVAAALAAPDETAGARTPYENEPAAGTDGPARGTDGPAAGRRDPHPGDGVEQPGTVRRLHPAPAAAPAVPLHAVPGAAPAAHPQAPAAEERAPQAVPRPAPVPPSGLVGVADGLFAAVLAARAGVLVPQGRTAEFLAPYPVAALGDEDLADLLGRLGIHTVGAFAVLSGEAVADRFGPAGTAAHRLARGLQARPLTPRRAGPDLAVEQLFDPPEESSEPLVFVGRALADRLHARLGAAGLACQRVAVEVTCADGGTASRLWRHEGRLGSAALAERVRWQLQAWQGAGRFPEEAGGFTALRLVPDGLVPDRGRQLALWGQAVVEDRVERAVARVQALLGYAGLRRVEPAGGRSPGEWATRTTWTEDSGERHTAGATAPWPGRVQDPAPSVVPRAPLPVSVLDAAGQPVGVDGRAEVSAPPARIALDGRVLEVTGWTGPWPAVEHWWDPALARRRARFQVAVADGRALLLTVEGGRWYVEGAYD
ncbi:impB/mucB/samB family protein [Streptomyces sp. TLI_235]|nr:DNA polymerase Y family protein [Streptomyces sp. TLI_235]PBC71665.1 impB/mucB/samB family protein [Streptomyces sp. TLI_235]